jgi:ornithine cyclodeaminase/alanine dehydrogenase-like protein (mu-crystallin family)
MAKEFGVAVLGTGWVAGEHIKAFQQNPHTEVVALLSRDKARAEARAAEFNLAGCRSYTNLDEALKDPRVRIVSVCTPRRPLPRRRAGITWWSKNPSRSTTRASTRWRRPSRAQE